jgi:hypothetical protein
VEGFEDTKPPGPRRSTPESRAAAARAGVNRRRENSKKIIESKPDPLDSPEMATTSDDVPVPTELNSTAPISEEMNDISE